MYIIEYNVYNVNNYNVNNVYNDPQHTEGSNLTEARWP